ncbi:putative tail length tape measure protein, partial [Clostridium botulinum CFSAN001627]
NKGSKSPSGNKGLKDANNHLKNIDDKIDISNEHLEMMRDLAEMESIQNFVTLTPTVQVTTGDIKEEADINKIISKIELHGK